MRNRLLLTLGGASVLTRFQSSVMATAPLAYLPMQETSGTVVTDLVAGRNWTASNVTVNQTGQVGKSYLFGGVDGSKINPPAALSAALTIREYMFSCWIKVNANAALQVRIINTYSSALSEYSVLECRTGNQLDSYLREQGTNQSITNLILGTVTDGRWHFVAFFNSESTNSNGIYIDGEWRSYSRTTPGATATAADNTYPEVGNFLAGNIQHVALWNRVLTTTELDTLYNTGKTPTTPWSLSYLLQDEFTVAEAAPMASPRASGLELTDTSNKLSIEAPGGQIQWSTKTTNAVDPRAISAALSKLDGNGFKASVTPGSIHVGLDTVNTRSPQGGSLFFQNSVLYWEQGGNQIQVGTVVTNGTVTYQVAIATRKFGFGATYWIKGGAFTDWTLLISTAFSAMGGYGGLGVGTVDSLSKIDYVRYAPMPYPLNDNFSATSTRFIGDVPAASTFTHQADFVADFYMAKLPSADAIDLRFRRQDATNYWQLTIGTTGVITLNEVVSGTPTDQAHSGAAAIAADSHLILIARGSTIQVINYAGGLYLSRINYATATNFATATAGEYVTGGTAGLISDLCIWNKTATAAQAAALDAI